MGQASEKLTIDYVRNTCPNPYYLQFINKLGGRDHWLFSGNKTLTRQSSEGVEFETRVETVGYQDNGRYNEGSVVSTGKRSADKVLLVASGLTESKRDGLINLFDSDEVYLLTNPDTWNTEVNDAKVGPIWERVTIDAGTIEQGDTKQGLYELQFRITRQPFNNITK
jgi:hypothetical protein